MSIESLMAHVMGRPVRVVLSPPEPDGLLGESRLRAEGAARIASDAYGPWADAVPLFGHRDTDAWPDPYGPDPVVFGAERRVKGWNWL